MTISSTYLEALASFSALSLYRALVATPIDGVARREALADKPTSTLKIIKNLSFPDYWKGFKPNCVKFFVKTGTQVLGFKGASTLAPEGINPTLRGVIIGVSSNVFDVFLNGINNACNVVATRFIQDQNWKSVKKEGPTVFAKGLLPTLIHRSLSGAVFWGIYEHGNAINQKHPALLGMSAGLVQVLVTSPWYVISVIRQGINPPKHSLPALMKEIVKTQGVFRGLFQPGLVPRSLHSIITSAPFMLFLEKYKIIHR